MRFIFTILVTAVVVIIQVMDNPEMAESIYSKVSYGVAGTLNDKEIRIEGLELLSRHEVEKLLPTNRGVAWWLTNTEVIQARVQENPWIARATVSSCSDSESNVGAVINTVVEWGCFVISVTERSAQLRANVDGQEWLIAKDGTFLTPLSNLKALDSSRADGGKIDFGSLAVINGLASRESSPDLLAAQLNLSNQVVSQLSLTVGLEVSQLAFRTPTEVAVTFIGLLFPVIFDGSGDQVSLSDQGERCHQVLKRFQGRLEEISSIDLAFDRVGVVKLKPS